MGRTAYEQSWDNWLFDSYSRLAILGQHTGGTAASRLSGLDSTLTVFLAIEPFRKLMWWTEKVKSGEEWVKSQNHSSPPRMPINTGDSKGKVKSEEEN